MSSAPVPPDPPNVPAPNPPPPRLANPNPVGDTGSRAADKIVLYRHAHLFYWWPVWALGFLFAGITYFDNQHLAIVPANTEAFENVEVEVERNGKKVKEVRHVLILDEQKKHRKTTDDEGKTEIVQPTIFVSQYRTLGSVYVIVLLLVIAMTNISIRGLWTVFVIVSIVMLTFIFAAAGWWESIFHRLNQLSIYINLGGYLLISTVLFVLWLVNFVFFDRQTYMIFTPGQVRVRTEIGGEETVYDVTGLVVQKQRADMFRRWVLGFGSGDLTIKPVGLAHPIEFPNVLFVGAKVAKIETMVKEKVIVGAPQQKPPAA
jgi:hypothetical protein